MTLAGIEKGLRGTLPTLLVRYRKAHSWTQEDLAAKTGLHWTTIGKVERGRLLPSLAVMKILADAFDVSVSHFVGAAVGESDVSLRGDQLTAMIDALPPIERGRLAAVIRALFAWRDGTG